MYFGVSMPYRKELDDVVNRGLERIIRDRSCTGAAPAASSARIMLEYKQLIHFSSNDYLGLANHPLLKDAAAGALEACGTGGMASRLMAGGTTYHHALEEAIARLKGTEAALALNSGYTANTSLIPALAREGDLILSDALNHASIVDGCRLSRSRTVIYRHRDVAHLRQLLASESGTRKIIVTDTVFSMDGDIAPLPDIVTACREHGALLYIDDAHGTGVLGGGRGTLHHFGITPEPWIIQMGTFSKALGSFGAYVAASRLIIRWLVNSGRGFIFSTALPAPVVAASLAAVELIERDSALNKKLWENRNYLADELHKIGIDTAPSETPIIPVMVGDIETTLAAAQKLFDQGIYAPAIRPPTVPTPRLRITVSAAHTREEIELLCTLLKEVMK